MQICQQLRHCNGELQSKDCPSGEFCIGWRLPVFCSTILLSHWLRLPRVEYDLGSKAEGNLKELTVRRCQLTSQALEGVLFLEGGGCKLCGIWDPSSPTRGWTHTPWRGRAVNHWTAREVWRSPFLKGHLRYTASPCLSYKLASVLPIKQIMC